MTANTHPTPIDGSIGVAAQTAPGAWHFVTLGGRLGRRAAVVLWVAATIGLGLYFGWSSIVAAGLASLVLGFLPCAAMCALGLCAASGGKICSSDKNIDGSQ